MVLEEELTSIRTHHAAQLEEHRLERDALRQELTRWQRRATDLAERAERAPATDSPPDEVRDDVAWGSVLERLLASCADGLDNLHRSIDGLNRVADAPTAALTAALTTVPTAVVAIQSDLPTDGANAAASAAVAAAAASGAAAAEAAVPLIEFAARAIAERAADGGAGRPPPRGLEAAAAAASAAAHALRSAGERLSHGQLTNGPPPNQAGTAPPLALLPPLSPIAASPISPPAEVVGRAPAHGEALPGAGQLDAGAGADMPISEDDAEIPPEIPPEIAGERGVLAEINAEIQPEIADECGVLAGISELGDEVDAAISAMRLIAAKRASPTSRRAQRRYSRGS